jgi:hypothetical protein
MSLGQADVIAPSRPRAGRPPIFETAEQMQAAIDQYYLDCDARKVPLTMSGLALAIGMSRGQLSVYEGRDAFTDTIKHARARVENQLEEGLLTRERQVAGHIFNLKNNFGWKDVQEVEHTHTVVLFNPDPPAIDITPLSPQLESTSALSLGPGIAVSDECEQAKATPITTLSPRNVA